MTSLAVTFILPDGREQTLEAEAGRSLMEVGRDADLIEGTCGGACACATCHVVVPDPWFDLLPPSAPEEDEMLDIVPGIEETSRLGCQVRLQPELDGMRVNLKPV